MFLQTHIKHVFLLLLNLLNLCLERPFLTLEQHWSLTQALLLWPTSCRRTSAVPPQCSEAPQSSSDSRRRSDSRSGALSAPGTCSPPRHAPFPRLTLEVLILLIGYRRRILLNYCHGWVRSFWWEIIAFLCVSKKCTSFEVIIYNWF